jgi:hypothetical protein
MKLPPHPFAPLRASLILSPKGRGKGKENQIKMEMMLAKRMIKTADAIKKYL